ncbi:TapB family protein [Candidatus Nitrospira bockiana]
MRVDRTAGRLGPALWAGAVFAVLIAQGPPSFSSDTGGVERVANAEDYFPDAIGLRWRYRGEVVEGPLQTIATKGFINISTVKGTDKVKGVAVKVFHDTNPGNHGPSDSYYRRDPAGIVYYGSEPGTAIEKQLIPYQIVRFPIDIPSSFQQFDRKGLDFGNDLDGDEVNEQADMHAVVTVLGKEAVTVPAGTYPDAIRIEARMTMRITLSGTQRSAIGSDTMTAWFAKGVGLVKYVERQELPPLKSDRGMVTEITEELESMSMSPQASREQ